MYCIVAKIHKIAILYIYKGVFCDFCGNFAEESSILG